jgi:predicted O-methyltransferase YrrM
VPCRNVFEVIPKGDRVRFEIEHIPSDFIGTPLEQLACLALITRATQPKTVFEIGTFRGRTVLNFALNAPDDAKVYTLGRPARRPRRGDRPHQPGPPLEK